MVERSWDGAREAAPERPDPDGPPGGGAPDPGAGRPARPAGWEAGRLAAARAPDLDRDDAFPEEDVADLARLGLLAAPLPPEHGGEGLGTTPAGAVGLRDALRRIGWGSLPLGRLYEGHVNALALVVRYGRPAQTAHFAAEARAGALFGVWNTEDPGYPLRLVAAEDGGPAGTVLRGGKTFASGAGFVARPIVTARDGAGRLLMVLPRLESGERADLSGWRAHGMRASATGTIDLDGVAVEPDEVIGSDGDYHRQPRFSGGAWRFAAVHLGGIERLLDELRAHHVATGRGGDPHQLARLGEAALAAETARLWVARAAEIAEAESPDPEPTVAYVNLARLAVERAGLAVLDLAGRSIGLAGYLRTHPIERLYRDLATYLRQPAPDRALVGAAGYVLASGADTFDLWPGTRSPSAPA